MTEPPDMPGRLAEYSTHGGTPKMELLQYVFDIQLYDVRE